MNILHIPCDAANYGGVRGEISYIVIHYTAGCGDTARSNGAYFANNAVHASAHFFVDERETVSSVPETQVAWHCGGASYDHPFCRNGNSIGVELCSVRENGVYAIRPATVARAAALVRELMARYDIPPERVLRHYDVTGKHCPEPFVRCPAAWQDFLNRLEADMTQEAFDTLLARHLEQLSAQAPGGWSREARAWAEQTGLIRGDGQSLAYRRPVTREELVEILYRMKGETP